MITVTKGGKGSGNFGHAGRQGKVGGSVVEGAPKQVTGTTLGGHAPDFEEVMTAISPKAHDVLNDSLIPLVQDDFAAEIPGGIDWRAAKLSNKIRSVVKGKIVDGIAAESGLPKKTVNDMIAQWAATSNGSDYRSLSLQEAAAEEFGNPLSPWQKSLTRSVGAEWRKHQEAVKLYDVAEKFVLDYDAQNPFTLQRPERPKLDIDPDAPDRDEQIHTYSEAVKKWETDYAAYHKESEAWRITRAYQWDKLHPDAPSLAKVLTSISPNENHSPLDKRENERHFLRTMYNRTQAALNLQFGEGGEVMLFRGVRNEDGKIKAKRGDVLEYKGNTMESWSVSKSVASDFSGDYGTVIAMMVPIKNILSMATTGFGCLNEGEFVVLDHKPGTTVRVVYNYKGDNQ